MELREELVKELTKDCKTQEDFNALFKALKKRGLEAALAGELTDHLGYDKHGRSLNGKSNSHNGYSKKSINAEGESYRVQDYSPKQFNTAIF